MNVPARIPPHNLSYEHAVLGAPLFYAGDGGQELATIIADYPVAMFYAGQNRVVAGALARMVQAGRPIDVETLIATLTESGDLDAAGDRPHVALLYEHACIPEHLSAYLAGIHALYRRREAVQIGTRLVADAFSEGPETEELISRTQRDLLALETGRGPDPILTPDRLAVLVGAIERKPGVPTGIPLLDDVLDGLRPGHLTLLAGRPGMGKSALAAQIADYAAVKKARHVALVTLEMSAREMGLRILALESGVSTEAIDRNDFARYRLDPIRATADVIAAIDRIRASGLFVVDEPAPQLAVFESRIRRAIVQHKAELVIVDHLGEIRVGARRENPYLEVGEVAVALKGLARRFEVPVLALTQLNRRIEQRQSPRPHLSDLRDSGRLEEAADEVVFVYTEEEQPEAKTLLPVFLYIAKNRHGRTGARPYVFNKTIGRMDEQSQRAEPRP